MKIKIGFCGVSGDFLQVNLKRIFTILFLLWVENFLVNKKAHLLRKSNRAYWLRR